MLISQIQKSVSAKRLGLFTESVIREQTRLSTLHQAVNLAQGFPDFPCAPELKRFAQEAVANDYNQYSVTWGTPGLRQAIAEKAQRYNGFAVNPDQEVTVTCGSTEAMMCAFLSLVDPGKEVILFQPFYENYHPDSYLAGAKPVYVNMQAPNWAIDEDELSQAFGPKTAAVILTNPHNPTGKVFTRFELERIAFHCQKWGVLVFCDEIYEHILYDGAKHISPASIPGLEDRTVTINSASKTYGVTGWRVGWAIAPRPLTDSLRKVHDFLTVCAATPLQTAVEGALGLPNRYYEGLALEYKERRDYFLKELTTLGFRCFQPQGAYYVMVDASAFLNKHIKDDVTLARHMVENVGVAVVPGSSFYRKGRHARRDLLRFCFCKRAETLQRAVDRLQKLKG